MQGKVDAVCAVNCYRTNLINYIIHTFRPYVFYCCVKHVNNATNLSNCVTGSRANNYTFALFYSGKVFSQSSWFGESSRKGVFFSHS
jgi:hypothetical protein